VSPVPRKRSAGRSSSPSATRARSSRADAQRSSKSTARFASKDGVTVFAQPEPSSASTVSNKVLSVSGVRSEEHTSELQSRFDLVCRLLLEKKNKGDSQRR